MDFPVELVLLGAVLALIVHVYALAVSRGSRSPPATAAFWSGILGLLSVPTAFALSLATVPFFIAGPGRGLSRAVELAWWLVAILPVVSILCAFAVHARKKQPR